MSTTPSGEPGYQGQTQPGQGAGRPGYGQYNPGMNLDFARLPFPGNAEFAVYALALILAGIIALVSDRIDAPAWFTFFTATTVAYLLSRGIAKASRVLEQ